MAQSIQVIVTGVELVQAACDFFCPLSFQDDHQGSDSSSRATVVLSVHRWFCRHFHRGIIDASTNDASPWRWLHRVFAVRDVARQCQRYEQDLIDPLHDLEQVQSFFPAIVPMTPHLQVSMHVSATTHESREIEHRLRCVRGCFFSHTVNG